LSLIEFLFGFYAAFVTWKEFYIHFLLAKGYDLETAQQHSEDYDTISLDPDGKNRMFYG